MLRLWYIVFAVFCFVSIACNQAKKSQGPEPRKQSSQADEIPDKQDSNGKPVPKSIQITADELSAAYLKDRKSADAKYSGKLLEVKGVVDNDTNEENGSAVIFQYVNGDKFFIVNCYMSESQTDEARALYAQQEASIIGTCHGSLSDFSVILRDCAVQDVQPIRSLTVTAEKLTRDLYEDNEAAEKKYSGKPVTLTGRVIAHSFDEGEHPQLIIGGIKVDGHTRKVIVEYAALHKAVFKTYKPGDDIKVYGIVSTPVGKIMLEKSRPIESE